MRREPAEAQCECKTARTHCGRDICGTEVAYVFEAPLGASRNSLLPNDAHVERSRSKGEARQAERQQTLSVHSSPSSV